MPYGLYDQHDQLIRSQDSIIVTIIILEIEILIR